MNAEDKEYIETKSLGKIRVVHVDMSQRMRQNSKLRQQVESNQGKSYFSPEEGEDIYALLQKIQDKRNSMEHKIVSKDDIKTVSTAKEVRQTNASSELRDKTEVENDKVNYITTSFNANKDVSEEKKECKGLRTVNANVSKQHVEEHVKIKNAYSSKLIFYTISILIVDIVLILLLHSEGTLFDASDSDDMTRYLCISIKYALVVHVFVISYSAFKDKKRIREGR